LLNRL